ncbi:putative reverse transcriptase zinc-binding domain-containing protein [Helianthus annuus]|nr:putative reverse transcriptase zinc-binding domain-containing protein [Helianthus annuus]
MVNSFPFGLDEDRWRWVGSKDSPFAVKSLRKVMEEKLFGSSSHWLKWVPIKLNCFICWAFQNRISVASNLLVRGVPLISGDCVHCHNFLETVDHIFIHCDKAKQVWRRVLVWSNCDFTWMENLEQLRLLLEEADSALRHKFLLGIAYLVLWSLWKARNDRIFKGINRSVEAITEEVVSSLFNWIKFSSNNMTYGWEEWTGNLCSFFL